MAITITTTPPAHNASGNPIIHECTSDRYASNIVAITSTTNSGIYVLFNCASHSYSVGDIITGSTFTGLNIAYNTRHTITATTATTITTDVLFVATATGSGSVKRTNDNFQIRVNTLVYDNGKKTVNNSGNNGGFLSITTSVTHGLAVGDFIYVYGSTAGNIDGVHQVQTITNNFTIQTWTTFVASSLIGTLLIGRSLGFKRQSAITVVSTTTFRINSAGYLSASLGIYLLKTLPTTVTSVDNNATKYWSLALYEEFDDAEGLTKTGSVLFSPARVVDRAVLQREEGTNIMTKYLASPINYLSNKPINRKIRIGEDEQIHFLINGSASAQIGIFPFDLGGNPMTATVSGLTTVSERGVFSINSNHFNNTMSKFEMILSDGIPSGIGETLYFEIDYRCYQNATRIYFENNLGGFDAFTFTGTHNEISTSKKSRYKKSLELVYDISDRGQTDLYSQQQTQYEVYSEFLTRAEALWLSKINGSVSAYVKNIGDTDYTPIIISDASQLIYSSNDLVQFKIVYQKATEINTLSN